VSYTTVERALRILSDENLISCQVGRGTFVNGGSRKEDETGRVILFSMFPGISVSSNWIQGPVYEGIQSVLETSNLSLMVSGYDNAEELLHRRDYQGLIFMMPHEGLKQTIRKFQSLHTPSVLISVSWPDIDIPCIDSDNEHGVRYALRYLAERGHTKVGYIDQVSNTCHAICRRATFRSMAAEVGIESREEWYSVTEDDYLSEKNLAQLRSIFRSGDRPTALLFSCFLPATIKIVAELRNMGLSLPEDVSIIGFDDSPWARCMDPALTVIEQPLMEMGRRAAKRLIEQINGVPCIKREVLPIEIVERDSVGIVRTGNRSEVLSKS
jgi:DNA-binding LacI/PurR family transcriptional regulator